MRLPTLLVLQNEVTKAQDLWVVCNMFLNPLLIQLRVNRPSFTGGSIA